MRIVLDQAFAVHTDGIVGFDCEAATVEQAFAVLFVEFPQLILHLSADKGKEAALTCARLNGRYLEDLSELYLPVGTDDILELIREVPDGSGKAAAFIPGALMIIVGAVTGQPTLIYAGVVSMAAAGIGMLLTGPYIPIVSNASDSPTLYSFDSIKNTTEPGTPIPLLYGRGRVGGHVLGLHTEVINAGQALFGLLGLCDGEVYKIETNTTQFNSLPVSSFTTWGLFPRLGTTTQEYVIPTFSSNISGLSDLYQTVSNEQTIAVSGRLSHIEGVLPATEFPILGVSFTCTGFKDYIPYVYAASIYVICDVYSIKNGVKSSRLSRVNLGDSLRFIEKGNLFWSNNDPTVSIYICFFAVLVKDVDNNGGNLDWIPDRLYPDTTPNYFPLDLSITLSSLFDTAKADPTSNVLPQFNKIQNTTSFADTKRLTKAGVTCITESSANSAIIIISAPVIYNSTDGSMQPYTINYTVQWESTTDPTTYSSGLSPSPYVFTDVSKSETFRAIKLIFPNTEHRYKIVVKRVTDESTDFRVADTLYLKEITEELNLNFLYPNTALLGYAIAATDQLSGSPPTVSVVVSGRVVSVPEGYEGITRTWSNPLLTVFNKKSYTNNPAFILYDIITSDTTLGGYYDLSFSPSILSAMQANFIAAANKCDELAYPDNTGSKIYRFSCDIIINNSASAREWITAILQTMRATLYYSNGGLFLDIDSSGKLITQLFNQGNLKEFTQNITTIKYPNSIELQFRDESNDFENTVILVEDPDLQLDPTIGSRVKTLPLPGVTNRTRAISLGKYALLLGKLCPRAVTFKTGTEGLIAGIGDLIGVQHESTDWGRGGRILHINGSTITLDTPFDLEAGSYKARISSRTAGTGSEEESILSFNGTLGEITLSSMPSSFTPAVGDIVIVGPATQSVKPFRVLSIKRSDIEEVELYAIEYNEDLYSLIDDIDWTYSAFYDQVTNTTTSGRSVSNVTAEPNYYQDSSGNWKVGIDVWYTKPVLSTWKGAILNWKKAEDTKYMNTPMDTSGHFLIPEVLSAGEYNIVVTSVFTTGMQQSPLEALADVTNHPWVNINITMYLPGTSFLEGVTGLRIEGAATDGTFTGKDCVVVWNKPTIIDQALAGSAGSEQWGAGTTTTSQMLKDYTVVVYNMDGTVRRIMFGINTERFVYTHEMNHEDSKVVRQFKISVVATDRLGRSSNPVEVTCFNPAPAKVR